MTIYYFTGTGNCLDTAKKLAAELGDCRLVPIKGSPVTGAAAADGDLGIVYPVYAYSPPRIVRDFIAASRFGKAQYVFSLATCGGTPGRTAGIMASLIRRSGGRQAAGFAIRTDSHPLNDRGLTGIIKVMRDISGKKDLGDWDRRKAGIVETVKNRKRARNDKSAAPANVLGTMLAGMAPAMFKKSAAKYRTDEACTSCGTCVSICPRGNVAMADGAPSFGEDCEGCNACIHWCPSKAIHVEGVSVPGMRSHNPSVTLSEMVG